MKAVVYRQDRGLVLENLPIPKLDSDQVLVAVANTGFCGSDHSLLEGQGLARDDRLYPRQPDRLGVSLVAIRDPQLA